MEDFNAAKASQIVDTCFCNPPLKGNNFGNMIYITYDLDAICPHCKAPFSECKPELIISNLETDHKMMQESLNLQMESLRDEVKELPNSHNDFVITTYLILFIISICITYFIIK